MTSSRLERRRADLAVVQRAAADVDAVNAALDRRLASCAGAADQLRLLRDATYQISRGANDAISAYRRVAGTVRDELAMEQGDRVAAEEMLAVLHVARADLLRVLERTSHRYPWAAPWPSQEAEAER